MIFVKNNIPGGLADIIVTHSLQGLVMRQVINSHEASGYLHSDCLTPQIEAISYLW